jgi:hypothetical protein
MRQVPRYHFLHQATAALIAMLITAGSANAQESEAIITVRTDGMPGFVAATVLEKSRHGIQAVVQYLNRTRMIHLLNPYDVLRVEERVALAEAPAREAVARVEPGQ